MRYRFSMETYVEADEETMRFKKFAAIILMSTMIGTMSLSGCGGVNKDAVAITMTSDDKDAIEVTMGYANFAARIQQAGYDSVFASYYGDDYWTNDSYAKDGKNMQESIKDSVLESIETQYLLEKHMSDYGVEITEEDQAAIKKAAEQFMSDNSKAALKEVGATQEYVERYLYLQTVEKRMKAAISATADTNVSDEEAAQRTFSYMKISLTTYTDESGKQQTYSADETTVVKKNADDAAQKAQSDFDGTAQEYSYDVKTYSYGSDEKSEADGGFCDAVIAAANSMTAGQVSGLIEGADCYYIIRLDSEFDADATEKKKESIISDRQDQLYQDVTDGYKDAVKIKVDEDEWAKVKFDNIFTTPSAADNSDSSATAE